MSQNQITRVAVLGLGTMGHGIALSYARAGCRVVGFDANADARQSLPARVRQVLRDFVDFELVKADEVELILGRISVVDDEALAVRDAEFVVEAISENLADKQSLFERIEAAVAPETILASNSSTFPISQSGARLRQPERAVVTHWFNPPHIVPTVEVVPSVQTNERTIAATIDLLRRAGKLAIRIHQELPGFLVNRVQIAVMREVWDLLDRGVASAADIDAAIRGSMGFRLAALGPLQIHDFGGLDIQTLVFRNLAPEIRSDTAIPATVQKIVDAGHLGFKTGSGFYDYPHPDQTRSDRDRRYLQLLRLLHHAPDQSFNRKQSNERE